MPKQFEQGHAKNLANFKKLISFITSYPQYNPSNKKLTLAEIQNLCTAAENVQDDLRQKIADQADAINKRQTAFADLPPLSSNIIRTLITCDADEKNLADAKVINRKIHGGRKKPKNGEGQQPEPPQDNNPAPPKEGDTNPPEPADQPPHRYNSVSQLSYDFQMEHFKNMIKLLELEPNYNPNEAELSIKGLNTKLTLMESTNTDYIDKTTLRKNAAGERNKLFYADKTGLVDVANNCKLYIKQVYGIDSNEYKSIASLAFRKAK